MPEQTRILKKSVLTHKKERKIGVFRSQSRFPNVSEKRRFFAILVRLNAFFDQKRV
jgi:hypothetical protein